MSTPNLPLSNVITVSVSTPPTGLSDFQVNNLAIFSKDALNGGSTVTITNPGIYKSPSAVAVDYATTSDTYLQAVAIFSQTPNILDGGGQLVVFPLAGGDTIASVVAAAQQTQFFHGLLVAGYAPNDAEVIAGAVACAALSILLFASERLLAALTDGTGVFAIISATANKHARLLLYTQAGTDAGARVMAAAYAGRAMCVDFSGSATTNTMHLKQLVGIAGDGGITQTVLNRCGAIGVDCYPIFGGRPSVFCSGFLDFFDNVYNLDWLVLALQVAGFNALATTGTKLPQTEAGMAVLRGAYIKILQKARGNGYVAPGAWNSPELFGSPTDLISNVAQLGYYVFSAPVSQQSQAARAARQAPLIQLAIKLAGAIHSSSVIVSVNP